MAFYNIQKIGLIEKAAQLAIKYGVVYSAKDHMFKGEAMAAEKATQALKQWVDHETSVQFRAERQW